MKFKALAGIVNYYGVYSKNNALFDPASYKIGEDLEYSAVLLKDKLKKQNIEINTLDVYPLNEYDPILFSDFPSQKSFPIKTSIEELHKMGKKLFLFLYETELTLPADWDKNNHKYFDKVFTWNDALVDGKKYIKFYYPQKLPDNFKIDTAKERKFCALISGNKSNGDPRELYSERVKAIRWFEKHHTGDFDLYGMDWGSNLFKRPSVSVFVKLLCLSRYLRPVFDKDYYPSYKGAIKSKKEILSKYKFSICYENAKDLPGYITEKIFDCFFAGTIPVYLGAPNVKDLIPANTFIDKRDFPTYEALYKYMKNMSEHDYNAYLINIDKFLHSKEIYKFSAEYYVDAIMKECFNIHL